VAAYCVRNCRVEGGLSFQQRMAAQIAATQRSQHPDEVAIKLRLAYQEHMAYSLVPPGHTNASSLGNTASTRRMVRNARKKGNSVLVVQSGRVF